MKFKLVRNLFLLSLLASFFYACSSSESTVVVVDDSPETEQTVQQDTVTEEFTELSVGLIDSVSNFDPLFAENLSTQRTLSLIYEGLYTLDRDGNPVPAIASDVEISEDSLEYVFTIDQDKFYHNSSIFTAGVGRRVNATDVKRAFERTASSSVPEHAAELLMGVRGFENFYLEQRSVYDPEKRVLDGVVGIQVLNRETVGIVLSEKDPDFLKKMASPYLFIYPQESINNRNQRLANNPVGTGPYQLNRVESSGRIVLSRDDRTNSNDSLINQINLEVFPNETQLFQSLTSGNIDWIPEIGPSISEQALNEEGNLQASYASTFNLLKNNSDRINAFYLNGRATVDHAWLTNRLAYLTSEDFTTRSDITVRVDVFEVNDGAQPLEQYYASYTDDTFARRILTELHNIIFRPESSLILFDIRVPTQQTSIYTLNSSSMQEALDPLDDSYWLRLDTQILGLYKNRVTGIKPTSVPWLLHIDQVGVRNNE